MRRFIFLLALTLHAETLTETPFAGVTHVLHTALPRNATAHVIVVDLLQPGLRFRVTPAGGGRETIRQTTLEFLREQRAQVAINAHFFEPFPSEDREAFLIGVAASDGNVYSDFETPRQSYAILPNAPGLNIDRENHPRIVHLGDGGPLFNAVAGSAQIITAGAITLPSYGAGELTPGGPNNYSNADSWYERVNARSAIGVTRDGAKLILLVIDRATVGEAAEFLAANYGVWDALNMDGGGSTSLAMEDPSTHERRLLNVSPEGPTGRLVGSSLAVFAGN
jgi:hypothetical protein